MHRIFLFASLVLAWGRMRAETCYWTGLAGDGLWNTPANWSAGRPPGGDDDAVLDNAFFAGDFDVWLPDAGIALRTLRISPGAGRRIRLTLPSTNVAEPALALAGPGYGLALEEGAVFVNASGLAGGESLVVADSIRIADGATYIHRTRAAHANNIVRLLSSAPGTENGVFEFDVPRAAYTVSASNRVYGTLVLSSGAAGGTVSYTAAGASPFRMLGDLRIGDGVAFALNFSGPAGRVDIGGNLRQDGGVFTLAARDDLTTVVTIGGDLVQAPAARIDQSGNSEPELRFGGTRLQHIACQGSIAGHVTIGIDNPAGVKLDGPLQLPFRLRLARGPLASDETNLLALGPVAGVSVDSTRLDAGYVDGPLKKIGLAAAPSFLFPVGGGGFLRWLCVKDGTGDYTVTYRRDDPHGLSREIGSGLDHISTREYWSVRGGTALSPAVELSFADVPSGGVTDPDYLDVAGLGAGGWIDAGHAATTGDLAKGSVVSAPVYLAITNFTLASTAPLDNPLPLARIDLSASRSESGVRLRWDVDLPDDIAWFEVDGRSAAPVRLDSLPAERGRKTYMYFDSLSSGAPCFYRIVAVSWSGERDTSAILRVGRLGNAGSEWMVFAPPGGNEIWFRVHAVHASLRRRYRILTAAGKEIGSGEVSIAQDGWAQVPRPVMQKFAIGILQIDGIGARQFRFD